MLATPQPVSTFVVHKMQIALPSGWNCTHTSSHAHTHNYANGLQNANPYFISCYTFCNNVWYPFVCSWNETNLSIVTIYPSPSCILVYFFHYSALIPLENVLTIWSNRVKFNLECRMICIHISRHRKFNLSVF